MTTNSTPESAEWLEELEESAQGTDLYSAPGSARQLADAREDAGPGEQDLQMPSASRVDVARSKRVDLGEAMRGLEQALTVAASMPGWQEDAGRALASVEEALDAHIEVTEGDDGLLAEVVSLAPRLSNEVALINEEHTALRDALGAAKSAPGPEEVRKEGMVLLGRLALHRQRGADLVYEAYNVDIATAD